MTNEELRGLTREDFHKRAAALKPETRMLIDGKLVSAKSGEKFETVNPANDEVIAEVALGGAEDVDEAVASARKAFKSGVWSRKEPRARMEVMYRFADLIEQNAFELGLLDSLDVGKPIVDMLNPDGDVAATALTVRYFGEAIDKVEGIVTNTRFDTFHYIVRQPLGVVACIAPWNYPLMIAAWKVAPALAMGNSVVLEPAQQSPLSAIMLVGFSWKRGVRRESSMSFRAAAVRSARLSLCVWMSIKSALPAQLMSASS
jgi:acyl-CoA reductase-like NAD-dependent aldehyde dehydrogenase